LLEFDIEPILERKIVGAYLTYQNKHVIVRDMEGRSGATILRKNFDYFIINKAISKGVQFFDGCSFVNYSKDDKCIIVNTTKGNFKTKYLIGADGVFSQVRKRTFGKNIIRYAPAMEALVYVDEHIINNFENRTLFDFGGIPKGYGWIFPKKDHLNVGVFSIFGSKDIKQDLIKFMRLYKSFENIQKVEFYGFCIPVENRLRLYEKDNVLLVGDAAGFAESFYGEGIYFAIKSAILASEAINNEFSGKLSNSYTKLVKNELINDLEYSRLNARLFYPLQKFGYYQMVRNKHVNYYFSEIIAGKVNYKECFYKTIITSPYWLFSQKYSYIEDKEF
jgi:flavin-dependent dehydrogenase